MCNIFLSIFKATLQNHTMIVLTSRLLILIIYIIITLWHQINFVLLLKIDSKYSSKSPYNKRSCKLEHFEHIKCQTTINYTIKNVYDYIIAYCNSKPHQHTLGFLFPCCYDSSYWNARKRNNNIKYIKNLFAEN